MPKAAKDATPQQAAISAIPDNLPKPLRVLRDSLRDEKYLSPLVGWGFNADSRNGLGAVIIGYRRGSIDQDQLGLRPIDLKGKPWDQLRLGGICPMARICVRALIKAGFPKEGGQLLYGQGQDGRKLVVLTIPTGKSYLCIISQSDRTGTGLIQEAAKAAQSAHARPSTGK